MSAPHARPVDPPVMPTMVSRLPKFGSRPKPAPGPAAGAGARLTNGFYHHPGPSGVDGGSAAPPPSARQNGFIRAPGSFSAKWRKEDGGADAEREWRGGNRHGDGVHQLYSQRQQGSQRDARRPTASSAGRGRGFGQAVTSSPSPQSGPRTLPVSKSGSHGSKPSQMAPGPTSNGLLGSKPRGGTGGSLRRPQSFVHPGGSRPGSGPGSRCGSPFLKKPSAGRSHSSDSLGSAPSASLSESDRFRSRSLTQVRQQPSPTLTPSSTSSSSSLPRSPTVTRSYSTGRAAGRSPPAQAPPRGGVSSQSPDGRGRGGGVGGQSAAASGRSGVNVPSTLRKPLLPSLGSASRPSGISYKMSRPSLIKQSRPLRATPASLSPGDPGVRSGLSPAETPPTTETSPETTPEAPEREGLSTEPTSQAEVSIVGETLEDMSLSSTSSLDRNETSQEYMDDFDNLGNGGVGLMLLSSKNDEDDSGLDQSCAKFDEDEDDKAAVEGVAEPAGLCFLDDGVDWAGVRLSGDRAEHRLTQLSRRRRSSQPDYHDQGGSSLDLSPSDSCGSGGTYMWDEEGLEPLGGAAPTASIHSNGNTTHHIGSFDSDINSIDLLNNLDSCDLEDDDLMLDADFAEDASLHGDGDRMSHMAQWRRRQLCWGTQDVHNDNESDFQCYKLTEDPGNKRTDLTRGSDLILDLCPSRSPGLSPAAPGLGLDVEELAEDCSAVRSQLEYLQRLLLQDDDVDGDTHTTDAPSPEADVSSCSSDTQVRALLQEVQQLREELRSRDRTIAQLTLQLTVPTVTDRCRCQETTGRRDQHTQTSVTERESVSSQTPWREHASQILHPSRQEDQEPLMDQVSPPLLLPPPPTRAPPPADTPADKTAAADSTAEDGENDGKGWMKKRRGAHSRSLRLPQPSKLHLFLSQTSGPDSAPTAAAPPPKTRASTQPLRPHDPESGAAYGFKLKPPTLASSRLPKPKTH